MLVIFGGPDAEAQAAEEICRNAGVLVAHAMAGGRRVHPGNAYAADQISEPFGERKLVVWFECAPAPGSALADNCREMAEDGWEFTVCDHHRPGDPGYGRQPAEFLAASSIGQLVALLAIRRQMPQWHASGYDAGPAGSFFYHPRQGWLVGDDDMNAIVPPAVVLTAAADHCLAAAYRGECPGVEPDALMKWRVESRAAFQRRPVADVLVDIERARRHLREQWQYIQDCASDSGITWADFGDAIIPELPEAACREGIAYVVTVTERDGRSKRVLGAATPEQVRHWMASEGRSLSGVYGDPARGFAGGYLPS